MAKLEGAERQWMLDVFAQSDAIHRFEGFERSEMREHLDQAVLDGLATNAQIAAELKEYIIKNRTTDGFLESRTWLRKRSAA